MCGICGIFHFNGQPVERNELSAMNKRMVHRGPDDEGYFIENTFGFAMRRLSIIDLEGGRQPISNEDGRYRVILNGEIYNYVELRKELLSKGHKFKSNSDTEVIVHLFEEFGSECLEKLNGMFAFALWDSQKKELFICRDRIGIKPLFYTAGANSFVFCSDLTGITTIWPGKKEISLDAFLFYLGLSYIPYPHTIFKDINKLEPGHFIKISANGRIDIKKYWDVTEFETLNLHSIDDYKEQILELLRDSIRLQMRSDVPIGTFLSGGLDSSCVVALLAEQLQQPVKTFSVGFEGGTNELPYAKLVADKFKTDHTEVLISSEHILNTFPEIINNLDEPISDTAMFPTLILSKIAVENGVKVILNGTGGDELFGGYHRYIPHNKFWKIMNILPLNIRKLAGNLFGYIDTQRGLRIADPMLFFYNSISIINYNFAEQLFQNNNHYGTMVDNIKRIYGKFVSSDNLKAKAYQLMYLDLKDYLVGDILSLLDKMTMAVSLEGRVPLLDHRIVEMSFKIPDKIKFKDNRLKGLLRDTLKGIVPDEILNLPKAGFAGPTKYWINNSLKKTMYKHLIENPIPFYKEYFNLEIAKKALDNNDKYWRYSQTLFSLYIFSLWYRKHIEGHEVIL